MKMKIAALSILLLVTSCKKKEALSPELPITPQDKIGLPATRKAEGRYAVEQICGTITRTYFIDIADYYPESLYQVNFAEFTDDTHPWVKADGEYGIHPVQQIFDRYGDWWKFHGATGQFSPTWDTLRVSFSMEGISPNSAGLTQCTCIAIRQ